MINTLIKKYHFFLPELLLEEDDLDEELLEDELLEEDLLDEDRELLADEERAELLFLVELLLLGFSVFLVLEDRDFEVELLFLLLVEDFEVEELFLLSLLVEVPELFDFLSLLLLDRRSIVERLLL